MSHRSETRDLFEPVDDISEAQLPPRFPEAPEECRSDGVFHGRSPLLFNRIHEPSTELAVWERSLPDQFDRWLQELPPDRLPNGRVLVTEASVSPALASILNASRTPGGHMRQALLNDIAGLVSLFMVAITCDAVDIRLEAIRHNACRKFHRDCVSARLLTTYRGPGTQWVPPEYDATALALQTAYDGPLMQFPRHAVGLFKGSCAGPSSGIVHRSPPIAGTDCTRLLLCLNTRSKVSPSLWEGL